ncbi:MAG: hypothetical protein KBC22_02525 [Candidatus Pacebacteria bacterium]|nr:hypothetical protein [Candidatus Paceibacterota bacterium]
MNNIQTIKNFIVLGVTAFGMLAIGFMVAQPAYAACDPEDLDPTVATQLPSNITDTSVTLNAYFASRDACYDAFNPPQVIFEFGESSTMDQQSEAMRVASGAKSLSIEMEELDPGQTYYYRAVMYYGNTIVKGDKVKFSTLARTNSSSGLVITESNTIVNNSGTNTTNNSNSNSSSSSNSSNSSSRNSGSSNSDNDSSSQPASASNGVAKISITNDQDVVQNGAYVTYEIEYANIARDRELENAVIVVTLPQGMEYVSGSADVKKGSNSNEVVIDISDLDPQDSGDAKVTVRVRKITSYEVMVQATLNYRDLVKQSREKLSVFDIDQADNNGSPLAAGLFGAGFMPGNLLGLFLVAILLIAIIYIVRVHFMKKDYFDRRVERPKYAQEHAIGEAPRATRI